MKFLRRLLFLAVFVILAAGIAGLLLLSGDEPVINLQGSNSPLLTRYYQRVRARGINADGIRMTVDGAETDSREPGQLIMSEEMQLKMPSGWLNDYFSCDVYAGENGTVTVHAGDEVKELSADEEGMVSVEEAAEALGFALRWEEKTRTAALTSPEKIKVQYPASYDLRDDGRVSPVRDQAQWATCWAFAALSAVESSLLPETVLQFSAEHLSYHHGFQIGENTGGDFNMALAYLVSWKGPVTEEEDPYGDEYSPDDLKAAVHVQNAVMLADPDTDRLKALIYENGAVESAIYARQDLEAMSGFYDPDTAAYYYTGEEACNHDIDIIGWDDSFSKENFPQEPPGDGAFLCKNSWGESFGDGGYFYISYYDVNIGKYGAAYTGVESADNYDHIYQCDDLGWTGSIGYGDPEAMFAAVYTAGPEETLSAAGFYSTDPGTWYDLYLVRDFEGAEDFADMQYLRSGYLADRGFFTAELGEEIPLEDGERFAVVVRIRTKDATHPVAMEYAGSDLTSTAKLDDGETYMSPEGTTWAPVEEAAQGNACLKVYTRDMQ